MIRQAPDMSLSLLAYKVSVSTMTTSYTFTAVKPLFTPLFSADESSTMYYNAQSPKGCGNGSISASAKGQMVVLFRGQCTFVEKVSAISKHFYLNK